MIRFVFKFVVNMKEVSRFVEKCPSSTFLETDTFMHTEILPAYSLQTEIKP